MKRYRSLIYLLISCVCHSQSINILPDSLKELSYKDLDSKLLDNRKKLKNSYIYAKAILLKAKEEDNINEIINGYSLLGYESNNFSINLKFSDSAIKTAKDRNQEQLAYLFYTRGNIYYGEKKLKNALNCFLRANEWSKIYSNRMINQINYSIGLIKNTQGNYDEAICIYKKCEENSKKYKNSNYPLYILGLSELYNKINNIELSEKYIQKGITSCKEYEDGESYLPYFFSNRGKNYLKKHQYQKAIQYLKGNLNTIKKNNDFSNYAENNFFIGECYWNLNKRDKAIEYYKKVDSVFSVKKDIYLQTIPTYNRLIEYYKKKQNYKDVLFYTEQFIKADKVLDENYKYLTNKIAKKYDIQNIIASKQEVVLSLKKDNSFSNSIIKILFIAVIFIFSLFYINNKKRNAEIINQKKLFEEYKREREQQLINDSKLNQIAIERVKKKTIENIDENVVAHILNCLKQFEEEKMVFK